MTILKHISVALISVISLFVMLTTTLPISRQYNLFTAYADNIEILEEDDYDDFHWQVTANGKLIIFPKEGETEAKISDFFHFNVNPDPTDVTNYYYETPKPTPWSKYSDSITSVAIRDGITDIGAYAFDSIKLSSLYMADSVQYIGKKAFQYSSIEDIRWSKRLKTISVSAFEYADIKELNLPDSLVCIRDSAFAGTNIKKLELPHNLETICNRAFENCSSLVSVNFPNSLKEIGEYAFLKCSSLSEINLPDSLETLSAGSFRYCYNMTSVTFGKSIIQIPYQCFSECRSLKSVIIDGSISYVGLEAFDSCVDLSYVYVGKNVTRITHEAFSHCNELEKIVITDPDTDLSDDPSFDNKCVIYGAAGGEVQAFAEEMGIPFEVYGDVNLDGDFNVTDFMTLRKWLLGVSNITLKSWQQGDFIMDGKLDVFDLCLMKRKLVNHLKLSNDTI